MMCPQKTVTFADNTECTVCPHSLPHIKSDLESCQNEYQFDYKGTSYAIIFQAQQNIICLSSCFPFRKSEEGRKSKNPI